MVILGFRCQCIHVAIDRGRLFNCSQPGSLQAPLCTDRRKLSFIAAESLWPPVNSDAITTGTVFRLLAVSPVWLREIIADEIHPAVR